MDGIQSEVSHILGTVLSLFEIVGFVLVYIAMIALSAKHIGGRIAMKMFGRAAEPGGFVCLCVIGFVIWIIELVQEFPVDINLDFYAHLRVATRTIIESNLIFALVVAVVWLVQFILSKRETREEDVDVESKQALPV